MSLIHCPACAKQVSQSAKQCVRCGHPMKQRLSTNAWVGICLGALITTTLAVGGYRLAPLLANASVSGQVVAAETVDRSEHVQSLSTATARLAQDELHQELMAYSIRVNRLTPYKPNPMVTLHRLTYQQRPVHLTYEYELNAMNSKQPVDFDVIAPIHERRYCTSPELQIASANGVPVTWRYYDDGRLVFENTVGSCVQNRVALH